MGSLDFINKFEVQIIFERFKLNMNKRYFFVLLVITFITFMSLSANAQQPPDPPDPTTPIDGGVGFLLAAGLLYGLHRYNQHRKK